MKLILVNQRHGHTRTIVIRGWMKGLLSLCLLGAPVALGYLGYELALADSGSNALVSQEAKVASDEFISRDHHALLPAYLSTFAEGSSGPARSSDSYYHALAIAAGVISPLAQLASRLSIRHHPQTRAVFAHGRLIDPAVYSSHTRH